MSLKDIANGCKGSEGTITLGPMEAQELLVLAKDNGTYRGLKKASSSTRLVTGKNKDEKAAMLSGESEPDGTYIPTGNGGIEISCIVLNQIVFGEDAEEADDERAAVAESESVEGPRVDHDPLNPENPDEAFAAAREVGKTANKNKSQILAENAEEETETSEVVNDNVAVASDKISRMISREKLQHIADTDTRVGVQNAAKKRLSELPG